MKNNLLTEEKQLLLLESEWHPTKNDKAFSEVSRHSHYRAWWKCSICSHEYRAMVYNRTGNHSGCNECQKVKKRGNKNISWRGFGEISSKKFKSIKHDASRRNLEFSITIEYIWNLFLRQNRTCVYSGQILTMCGEINGKYTGTASLDRIDSTRGYIEDNVQWIASYFQPMKMDMDESLFFARCIEIADYQMKGK